MITKMHTYLNHTTGGFCKFGFLHFLTNLLEAFALLKKRSEEGNTRGSLAQFTYGEKTESQISKFHFPRSHTTFRSWTRKTHFVNLCFTENEII